MLPWCKSAARENRLCTSTSLSPHVVLACKFALTDRPQICHCLSAELQLYLVGQKPAADTVEVICARLQIEITSGMACPERARDAIMATSCHHNATDTAWQASADILFFRGEVPDHGSLSASFNTTMTSSSGRTGHVEYCRTFGVLITNRTY